jgi:hypothetical protein
MSYPKDSMHKLWSSALVGVTRVFHFFIMHGINKVKFKVYLIVNFTSVLLCIFEQSC